MTAISVGTIDELGIFNLNQVFSNGVGDTASSHESPPPPETTLYQLWVYYIQLIWGPEETSLVSKDLDAVVGRVTLHGILLTDGFHEPWGFSSDLHVYPPAHVSTNKNVGRPTSDHRPKLLPLNNKYYARSIYCLLAWAGEFTSGSFAYKVELVMGLV